MRLQTIAELLFFVILSSLCLAQEPDLWEQKLSAQIEYQKWVANLLLKRAPKLEEIILIARDLQITMYSMKRQRYLYLTYRHPRRIDPDKDFNFEWTADDEKDLLKLDKNYVFLKKKKEDLMARNQGHPMWPALREVFSQARETAEYKEMLYKLKGILSK